MYDTKQRFKDEDNIDRQIVCAKIDFCIRRFRSTNDRSWLDLAERHCRANNGFADEVDRRSDSIADVVAFVGARRVG